MHCCYSSFVVFMMHLRGDASKVGMHHTAKLQFSTPGEATQSLAYMAHTHCIHTLEVVWVHPVWRLNAALVSFCQHDG